MKPPLSSQQRFSACRETLERRQERQVLTVEAVMDGST